MKDWIIVDLDGTLCDCSHRVHLAQAKQWNEFHAGIPSDSPVKPVLEFCRTMSEAGYEILLCTGRDERHRDATLRWIGAAGAAPFVQFLLMRPDKDRSSDHELKPRLVYEFFGSKEEALEKTLMVLDDRDRVVEAWRDEGFTCWQVQAGSY